MEDKYLYNEKELIAKLRESDEAAFEMLYHKYSNRLLGNLIKLLKSETLATEALQDVFIKIWDLRHQLDPEKSFRSFLFKVGENIVYDFFRKAARDKTLQQKLMSRANEHYLHVEESIFQKEDTLMLQNAIDALPPQRKLVFNLCRVDGKTYEEAGKLLGISTSTISDHIVKANRFIQQYLSGDQQTAIAVLSVFLLNDLS